MHRVADLTSHLDLAQSTVSSHLACPKDCGLVHLPAQGPGVDVVAQPRQTVTGLLASGQQLLAQTGDAVSLGPNLGVSTLKDF